MFNLYIEIIPQVMQIYYEYGTVYLGDVGFEFNVENEKILDLVNARE